MLALGCSPLSLPVLGRGGGAPAPAPAPAPGLSATAFPTAPASHYHFTSQPPTVDGSNRLVSATDLRGLADMTTVPGKTAPTLMTDALGRKFLRFNGNEVAAIANALTTNSRAFTVVFVGRSPHLKGQIAFLNPRYEAYTSPTVNTASNTIVNYLQAYTASSSVPTLHAGKDPSTFTNLADCYKVIPGAQMQVLAVASRTTANGGTRLYTNTDKCDVAQQTFVKTHIGALIAGTASTNNSTTCSTSQNHVFDCYALAIWVGELSNAQADAVVAAAVANYAIPQLDSNLVLAGDSITDGIAATSGPSPAWSGNLAVRLTEPGSELVGGNVRVLNTGVSGSQTSNLLARRDAIDSLYARGLYPGGPTKNRVAVHIGRNDCSETGGKKNSAMAYADVVALINTPSTGYLQRGWSVTQVANIGTIAQAVTTNVSPAGEDTIHKRLAALRGLIADTANHVPQAQFLTDTLSNTGQAYEGRVSVLHLYEVTIGRAQPFRNAVDASTTYPDGPYANDGTHLTTDGHTLMATGGDTPQFGYGSLA